MAILMNPKLLLAMVVITAISIIVISPSAFAAGSISQGFKIGEVLPESVGWFIVVGLGAVFAIVISLEIKVEEKFLGHTQTSEFFNTAGRTIGTGLTAAAIVSAWTWAATLLQSSTVAYQYGISGPFWYAAGASIQVILFGILAIELKRKAPMTHTFPELVNARFGKTPHKVFLGFAFLTNTIVTSMLILGGAAVIQALTGIDVFVASFLIPIGIVIYTLFGGLKATFYAEYLNTAFIFGIILVFTGIVYFGSSEIGGIGGMYEKLASASARAGSSARGDDVRRLRGRLPGAHPAAGSLEKAAREAGGAWPAAVAGAPRPARLGVGRHAPRHLRFRCGRRGAPVAPAFGR